MPQRKESEDTSNITSMRDVKLSDSEKRTLYFMGIGVLVAFTLAILVFQSLTIKSEAISYPGNCGNSINAKGLDSCLSTLANTTENVTDCLYIPDSNQQKCILNLAYRTKNASVCSALDQFTPTYATCINNITKVGGNISLCDQLSSSYAIPCIYNVSNQYSFASSGICNGLNVTSYRNLCYSLYYYKTAQSIPNETYCYQLPDTINSTVITIITYSPNAPITGPTSALQNIAELGFENITPRDLCDFAVAIKQNAPNDCMSLSNTLANQCTMYLTQLNITYNKFNLNAQNLTAACGAFTGYRANLCTEEYANYQAVVTKSTTPCELLNSTYNIDTCILNLAVNTSTFSFCSQISNATYKSICNFVGNATRNGTQTNVT